jgi:hypothetical protein
MTKVKEDPLERKEMVLVLYLMGNVPEMISERLALPVKNVRSDLRSMGILALEDNKKAEKQIMAEVRQETELIKHELWEMYLNSKNTEEKLKIATQLKELISVKADTIKKTEVRYLPNYSNNEKIPRQEKGNNFAWKNIASEPAVKETPGERVEIIDLPSGNSCARFIERPMLTKKVYCLEEFPTKS